MSIESFSTSRLGLDIPTPTDGQLHAQERAMAEVTNWRGDHSVPSSGAHYRYMWKWDSYKAMVINARRGDPDRAALEFSTMERYRDPRTGFLPNKIFATAAHKTWRDYPEAWTFNNNRFGSSYSQPPLAAWSATEIYRSFLSQGRKDEATAFLAAAYGTAGQDDYRGLQGEYAYFINHRQNGPNDPLIGIVHPNESGRDSDEANKPWLAYGKGNTHTAREWLHMQWIGYRLGRLGRDPQHQRIDWIPEQIRRRYWVNDVMFNCIHANNLRYLADIAVTLSQQTADPEAQQELVRDSARYRGIASDVEQAILTRMWDEEQGFFYNLDQDGNRIPVKSITGLFPLMLENIRNDQLESLVDKFEDPKWFASEYPILTHALCSRFCDPNPSKLKTRIVPPWSGSVWVSPNHLLVEEGLVPRAQALAASGWGEYERELAERCMRIAGHIAVKTFKMLAKNPKLMECYSAVTGEGLRVEDFMWSLLGLHFEKYERARKTFAYGNLVPAPRRQKIS